MFRETPLRNRFKREKKQQKHRKLQKVVKKWPDTPLQKIEKHDWQIDRPVWDSVLDLNFCTPFQHFLQKVVFLRETSSLCYMKKSRCLTRKHYFLQKVLEWCAKHEVQNAAPNRAVDFLFVIADLLKCLRPFFGNLLHFSYVFLYTRSLRWAP